MQGDTVLYFTTGDLARRWQRSPDRVRQYARSNKLHAAIVTQSGQRLFAEAEVIRFEREREQGAYGRLG